LISLQQFLLPDEFLDFGEALSGLNVKCLDATPCLPIDEDWSFTLSLTTAYDLRSCSPWDAFQTAENPRRIAPPGVRLTISRGYFAQQLNLSRQQAPPPQQSAEREVAFAVPTSAIAATIINKYFIESSC
jgi:hypothetical protein